MRRRHVDVFGDNPKYWQQMNVIHGEQMTADAAQPEVKAWLLEILQDYVSRAARRRMEMRTRTIGEQAYLGETP